MDYDQILDNLKRKIYHPVYFLCGEEPYFSDIISDFIEENVLTEAEKGFNQTVFYGKDTEIITVIEASRRFPMMASHQVIIVKEAQSWKNLKPLASYISAPSKSTLLVINYKYACLLYTSDAADDLPCVDLGGSRLIKKKKLQLPRSTHTL